MFVVDSCTAKMLFVQLILGVMADRVFYKCVRIWSGITGISVVGGYRGFPTRMVYLKHVI